MFKRGTDEFTRVVAFSDGVFAIAMTLLVVAVAVPTISDADSVRALAEALDDQSETYVSFFLSFAVIGRYWVAHHDFIAMLAGFDKGIRAINLFYLAFIAFLPFPTDLLGTYFDNPLSITVYAFNVAAISGLEVVMFRHAYRAGLMKRPMPEPIFRWGVLQAAAPVFFFIASIPVAFLSTTAAVLVWALGLPFGIITGRHQPEGFDEYFSPPKD